MYIFSNLPRKPASSANKIAYGLRYNNLVSLTILLAFTNDARAMFFTVSAVIAGFFRCLRPASRTPALYVLVLVSRHHHVFALLLPARSQGDVYQQPGGCAYLVFRSAAVPPAGDACGQNNP